MNCNLTATQRNMGYLCRSFECSLCREYRNPNKEKYKTVKWFKSGDKIPEDAKYIKSEIKTDGFEHHMYEYLIN